MQALLNKIQRAVTDFDFNPDSDDTLIEAEQKAENCIMENVDGFETYSIVETNNHYTYYTFVQDFGRMYQMSGELISGNEQENHYYILDNQGNAQEIKWFEFDVCESGTTIYVQLDKVVDVYGKVCLLLAEWCNATIKN